MGFDNECILNIQTLPGEYFCPVCRTLVFPNEALQTQCTHLFCKPCLAYVVATTRACPYDGYLVTEADSKPLVEYNKPISDAINSIQVHCLYHRSGCQWQGSFADCIVHCTDCTFGNSPVVCNRCHTQIVHRQVQEHAQICSAVQPQTQMDGTQNQTSAEQAQVVSQAVGHTSQVPSSQNVTQAASTTAPVPTTISTSVTSGVSATGFAATSVAAPMQVGAYVQPQTAAMAAPTPDQWYQQQQIQYQQYYQQYPGADPYQQQYQQQAQPQSQYPQSQTQIHPTQVQGQQTQPYVYPQSHALPVPPSHSQHQTQQLQPPPQSQVLPQPQSQVHGHVVHMQAPPNPQQPVHTTIQQPRPQIQSQGNLPSHVQVQGQQIGHAQPFYPPVQQSQLQVHPQNQLQQPVIAQHPSSQVPQANPQPYVQPPQQPLPHPQPQPNFQHVPPAQLQVNPQVQHTSTQAVSGHQSYPSQPPQMFPSAPQQLPVYNSQPQGFQQQPQKHVQMQSQFPPQMRPSQPTMQGQPGMAPPHMVPHSNQPHVHPAQLHMQQHGAVSKQQHGAVSQQQHGAVSQQQHGAVSQQQHGTVPQQQGVHPQQFLRPQGSPYVQPIPTHLQTQAGQKPPTENNGMMQQTPYTQSASVAHLQHSGATPVSSHNMHPSQHSSGHHTVAQSAVKDSSLPSSTVPSRTIDAQTNSRHNESENKVNGQNMIGKEPTDSGLAPNLSSESADIKISRSDGDLRIERSVAVVQDVEKNDVHSNEAKEKKEHEFANKEEADGNKSELPPDGSESNKTREHGENQDNERKNNIVSAPNENGEKALHEKEFLLQQARNLPQSSSSMENRTAAPSDMQPGEPNSNKQAHRVMPYWSHGVQDNGVPQRPPNSGRMLAQHAPNFGHTQDRKIHEPFPNPMQPHGPVSGPNLMRPPSQGFPEHLPHQGLPRGGSSDPFQPPMRHGVGPPHQELQSGFPGPGLPSSFGRGPGHFGSQNFFEPPGIAGSIPFHTGVAKSQDESLPGPPFRGPPGPLDTSASIPRPPGPDGQMGRAHSHMLDYETSSQKVPGFYNALQHEPRPPFPPELGTFKPNGFSNNIPERTFYGSAEGRFRPFPEERFADERMRHFPMGSGRAAVDKREFEEGMKQFSRSTNLDVEMSKVDNFSSSRTQERDSHISGPDSVGRSFSRPLQGFDHDIRFKSDAMNSRKLPMYPSDGSSLPGSSGGSYLQSLEAGQRLHGFRDDNLVKKNESVHPSFHGPGPDVHHNIDGHKYGSPGRDYSGIKYGQTRFDDRPEREFHGFNERSRLFNPLSPSRNFHGNEIGGPRNEFGNMPDFLPSHLRSEFAGLGDQIRTGDFPSNMRFGEHGFHTNFQHHGGSMQGDTFDQARKRKFGGSGWCRICKIDCETVEGLDLHSQTREHQKIAMDIVLSIKEENSRKKKMSEDNGLVDEKNKAKKLNADTHILKH